MRDSRNNRFVSKEFIPWWFFSIRFFGHYFPCWEIWNIACGCGATEWRKDVPWPAEPHHIPRRMLRRVSTIFLLKKGSTHQLSRIGIRLSTISNITWVYRICVNLNLYILSSLIIYYCFLYNPLMMCCLSSRVFVFLISTYFCYHY